MTCNFNHFVAKSDQELMQEHFKSCPTRYTGTKEWMFRFVCWLENLDGVYTTDKWQTAIKTSVRALAVFGMVVLCPLVAGFFLLNNYCKAKSKIEFLLHELDGIENDDRKKIISALGTEKRGVQIPSVPQRPAQAEIEPLFAQLGSPIFQCNDDFIAVLLQDKVTKAKRVAKIEKTNQGWKCTNLKLPGSESEAHMAGPNLPARYFQILELAPQIHHLKQILRGINEKDELAFDLIRKPQEELQLGGPCFTEVQSESGTPEHAERQEIIRALGGPEAVKRIPKIKQRPLRENRLAVFEQLKSPIFQSNGDFIAILMRHPSRGEPLILTIKQAKDKSQKIRGSWLFDNFMWFASIEFNRKKIEWTLNDGSTKTKAFAGRSWPTNCKLYSEFLKELIEGKTKHKLEHIS